MKIFCFGCCLFKKLYYICDTNKHTKYKDMKFEIVDKEGTLITNFDLEANPFKVGERITVEIDNYDKEFWSAEEVRGDYRIDKIEHYFGKDYTINKKAHSRFIVSVEVTKLP